MYECSVIFPMWESHVKLGISSPIWSGLAPVPERCSSFVLLISLLSSDIATKTPTRTRAHKLERGRERERAG